MFLFVLLSWTAVSGKSATYDEPMDVADGWLKSWKSDFRLQPEVPPLWEYWIALPLARDDLNIQTSPVADGMDHVAIRAMYQTPGADGVALVARARLMALPWAIAMALLVAKWAWDLGGPIAAIFALAAFVLDPNWLGHAPLAKNDVAFALVYFATAYFLWRFGCRASWAALATLLVMPAIGLGVKLTGLLVLPAMAITMGARSLLAEPWPTPKKTLTTWTAKAALATALLAAAGVLAYAGLWAQFRFRFDPAPGGVQLDLRQVIDELRTNETRARFEVNQPTQAQLATWKPGILTQVVISLGEHHLAPQAWVYGFLYTKFMAAAREGYLLGRIYAGGRWYYFPLAWLFKEPVSLIAAAAIAFVATARSLTRRENRWTLCALAIPAVAYLTLAMAGDLNIGLRHLLPVFPFIEVAIGLAAAKAWNLSPGLSQRAFRPLTILLALCLVVETLAAYPNFIDFFNFPCGGWRGGIRLLGDSNLDWGQDLPALAAWQNAHPNTTLYLEYFGTCDPSAYGIRFINMPGGYVYGPPPRWPTAPGVAAISASKLQRLFSADPAHDFATHFLNQPPIAILNGSIYLFDFPDARLAPPRFATP